MTTMFGRHSRRRLDYPPDSCTGCGYNLIGLPQAEVCPECGTVRERADLSELLRYDHAAWRGRLLRGLMVLRLTAFIGLLMIVLFFIVTVFGLVFGLARPRGGTGESPADSWPMVSARAALWFIGGTFWITHAIGWRAVTAPRGLDRPGLGRCRSTVRCTSLIIAPVLLVAEFSRRFLLPSEFAGVALDLALGIATATLVLTHLCAADRFYEAIGKRCITLTLRSDKPQRFIWDDTIGWYVVCLVGAGGIVAVAVGAGMSWPRPFTLIAVYAAVPCVATVASYASGLLPLVRGELARAEPSEPALPAPSPVA